MDDFKKYEKISRKRHSVTEQLKKNPEAKKLTQLVIQQINLAPAALQAIIKSVQKLTLSCSKNPTELKVKEILSLQGSFFDIQEELRINGRGIAKETVDKACVSFLAADLIIQNLIKAEIPEKFADELEKLKFISARRATSIKTFAESGATALSHLFIIEALTKTER